MTSTIPKTAATRPNANDSDRTETVANPGLRLSDLIAARMGSMGYTALKTSTGFDFVARRAGRIIASSATDTRTNSAATSAHTSM